MADINVNVSNLNTVLQLEHPGRDGWLLIVIMSLVPLATAPLVRLFNRRRKPIDN